MVSNSGLEIHWLNVLDQYQWQCESVRSNGGIVAIETRYDQSPNRQIVFTKDINSL